MNTSQEAYRTADHETNQQRAHAVINRPDGATRDQVELQSGMPHQSASSAVRALIRDNPDKYEDGPETRLTRFGKRARVVRVKK